MYMSISPGFKPPKVECQTGESPPKGQTSMPWLGIDSEGSPKKEEILLGLAKPIASLLLTIYWEGQQAAKDYSPARKYK